LEDSVGFVDNERTMQMAGRWQ